jgi:hypothetical protein
MVIVCAYIENFAIRHPISVAGFRSMHREGELSHRAAYRHPIGPGSATLADTAERPTIVSEPGARRDSIVQPVHSTASAGGLVSRCKLRFWVADPVLPNGTEPRLRGLFSVVEKTDEEAAFCAWPMPEAAKMRHFAARQCRVRRRRQFGMPLRIGRRTQQAKGEDGTMVERSVGGCKEAWPSLSSSSSNPRCGVRRQGATGQQKGHRFAEVSIRTRTRSGSP